MSMTRETRTACCFVENEISPQQLLFLTELEMKVGAKGTEKVVPYDNTLQF